MGTDLNGGGGWFVDYETDDEVEVPDFIWAPSQFIDHTSSSVIGFGSSQKEGNCNGSSCSKKSRMESCAKPRTKACREKMRRDKLNDKFSELYCILGPGRPPKNDKVAILVDATRRLNQLHHEAQMLMESNKALQETINKLKEEKIELRDEKARLKVKKEQVEEALTGLSIIPSQFLPYPPIPGGVYHPALVPTFSKASPYPVYPPATMWQWLPPATLDTSLDHVLRPPVA